MKMTTMEQLDKAAAEALDKIAQTKEGTPERAAATAAHDEIEARRYSFFCRIMDEYEYIKRTRNND